MKNQILVACVLVAGTQCSVQAAGYGSGLNTISQGISEIGSATVTGVKDKADKFVDTAGNVFTVVKDAHGQATKFVMNSLGTVFDVTKMAGTFVVNAAASYPKELFDSLNEERKELGSNLQMGLDAAATLGKFVMDSRPELPPLNQFHKPSAWKNAAQNSYSNLMNGLRDIEYEVDDSLNAYEEKYCKPSSYKPSVKKPTEITMPSFFFEVGLGGCEVQENITAHDAVLVCTKPYLEYGHKNGTFVAKRHTAPKFTAKECKHQKEFGEKDEITLFEFGSEHTGKLGGSISEVIGMAFGALSSGSQYMVEDLRDFVGELHANKKTLDEYVTGVADTVLSVEQEMFDQVKNKISEY
jgi:hypothetical protein